jgi:deoxyribodipyrimidine photolyase-related protein
MWIGEPFLSHSRLSAALNVKLISAREVIDAVLEATANETCRSTASTAFVRQVVGWREFVRGIYWRLMPAYAERNTLDAHRPLPTSSGPATPTCDACTNARRSCCATATPTTSSA